MNRIILVLLSEIDEQILDVLKRNLAETFNCSVETKTAIRSLDNAYNPLRKQYISPRLLTRLRRMKKSPGDKILGIVDVDLYSPGFDFVFGEAEIATGVGTLSLYRLKPKHYDIRPNTKLFQKRAVKEAVHELGHLFQLGHCTNPGCAMSFSTSLSAVDKKGETFCSKCQAELKKNVGKH